MHNLLGLIIPAVAGAAASTATAIYLMKREIRKAAEANKFGDFRPTP